MRNLPQDATSVRVLGIITARGGSKGVPRKNIRLLCGRPLLQYTAESALAAARLDRVILTTDDQEIADLGRTVGLDVPFIRPPDLARDDTPTLPVLQHAVRWVEDAGDVFDAICLLQPTNPLRRAADIDECVALFEQLNADSIVSVLPVPKEYNPHWVYFRGPGGRLALSTGETDPIPRRQDLPPAFHRDGSVYLTRRDVLMEENSLFGRNMFGYEMDRKWSANIDTQDDWEEVESRMKTQFTP